MVRRWLVAIIKNERGITLIEIAISMLLFAIVGIFILYGVAAASFSLALADERETAKNLAESEIEYIKLTDYSLLPTSTSWSYNLPTSSPVWDVTHVRPPGFDNYSILVQGNSIDIDGDGNNDDDMQMISVTVSNRGEVVLTIKDYVINP